MRTISQRKSEGLGTISLAAVGGRAGRICALAEAQLREVGFDARMVGQDPPGGPGIVFFDAAEQPLYDLLRHLSDRDGTCLLAIAVDPEGLGAGSAWRLACAGASDVFSYDKSQQWVARVAARVRRWRRVEELARSGKVRHELVGKSRHWRTAVRAAIEAACFTDAPIVLTGETGTGKELVARLIHSLDTRPRKRELVLVDCTTIVPTLSGSEFFGHERGAFTGATSTRDGAFALADGGTLFLDEVGELPLMLQGELLRVVQEGAYKRVGGNDWRKTSFRLISATNRDLFAEGAAGSFRHDLLYRLAGFTLRLPSLRERREDIVPLARHFLSQLDGSEGCELDDDVRSFLLRRDYPGNIRELRQLVMRMSYRHVGPGPITVGDVPQDERTADGVAATSSFDGFEQGIREALMRGVTLKEIAAAASDVAISVALAQEQGSLQRAARRLGVTPRALQLRRATGRLPAAAPVEQLPTGEDQAQGVVPKELRQ